MYLRSSTGQTDADGRDLLLQRVPGMVPLPLDEPFSVRHIVVLCPYKKRSAALAATLAGTIARRGADIADPGKIRWGTIHEFKGVEASAIVLTEIELVRPHDRRLERPVPVAGTWS